MIELKLIREKKYKTIKGLKKLFRGTKSKFCKKLSKKNMFNPIPFYTDIVEHKLEFSY